MKILSFGEILWDVYDDAKYIGGAPFNFAAHLTKHKEEVYMLTTIGEDELGKEALSRLDGYNIHTDYICVSNQKQTGCCLVTLDENSVPAYNLLDDVAYDYIKCDDIPNSHDVLYFGTLALRSKYNFNSLKELINSHSFKEIFVDVNIRPPFFSYATTSFALNNATILKISLEELPIVSNIMRMDSICDYKAFSYRLSNAYKNLSVIIVTLASDGAFVLNCRNGKEYYKSATNTEVKSTVGAGDSFSAAFLHKYMSGERISASLDYAIKLSGFVVSQYDAVPNYDI